MKIELSVSEISALRIALYMWRNNSEKGAKTWDGVYQSTSFGDDLHHKALGERQTYEGFVEEASELLDKFRSALTI